MLEVMLSAGVAHTEPLLASFSCAEAARLGYVQSLWLWDGDTTPQLLLVTPASSSAPARDPASMDFNPLCHSGELCQGCH